jgi:beta-lactamase regulating signal transducer with metallopeptidase domain
MIAALTNHLWQSTLFAIVAGLLGMALRKNRAQVRYWLWLSASLRFLVPFALLMSLGTHVQLAANAKNLAAAPAVAVVMERITEPFSGAAPAASSTPIARDWIRIAFLCVWVFGFLGVGRIRFRGWLRIRTAVRASMPVNLRAAVEVRSSPGLIEPGVVGVFRPFLLLPEGIVERLSPPQLEAVLAHELCHVRRRDNLWASIHMIVEAIFWFHPLVWWIGAKLVEERERACDEAVLNLGGEPRVYAEALLNVCKMYVESPLVCVSGVTGSDIKRRIEVIMTNRIVLKLNIAKKLALAAAAVSALAVPIGVGVLHAPRLQAQQQGQSQPQPPAVERVIAQAQTAPTPGGRGRGATRPAAPAATTSPELEAALATQAKWLEPGRLPSQFYKIYGPPDQIDDRSSDAQHPVQIWRYNYLEAFRSNVELEFAPGKPMLIHYPLPATFTGVPGVPPGLVQTLPVEFFHGSEPPAESTIAGFPGGHASMQIYPAWYRTLSMPMDSLSSPLDVIGLIRSSSGETHETGGLKPAKLATVRDSIRFSTPPAGAYTASFTLDAGSYVCSLVVRERATGRVYGETINFEVK